MQNTKVFQIFPAVFIRRWASPTYQDIAVFIGTLRTDLCHRTSQTKPDLAERSRVALCFSLCFGSKVLL